MEDDAVKTFDAVRRRGWGDVVHAISRRTMFELTVSGKEQILWKLLCANVVYFQLNY